MNDEKKTTADDRSPDASPHDDEITFPFTLAPTGDASNGCAHDWRTIEADDQAGQELVKCKACGVEQLHKLARRTAEAPPQRPLTFTMRHFRCSLLPGKVSKHDAQCEHQDENEDAEYQRPASATPAIPFLVPVDDIDRAAAAELIERCRYMPDSTAQKAAVAHAFASARRRERDRTSSPGDDHLRTVAERNPDRDVIYAEGAAYGREQMTELLGDRRASAAPALCEHCEPLLKNGTLFHEAKCPWVPRVRETSNASVGHTCDPDGGGVYDLRCAQCVTVRIFAEGPMLEIGSRTGSASDAEWRRLREVELQARMLVMLAGDDTTGLDETEARCVAELREALGMSTPCASSAFDPGGAMGDAPKIVNIGDAFKADEERARSGRKACADRDGESQ